MSTSVEVTSGTRGWFVTTIAVLFVILAISDFTKTLQHAGDPHLGLVILGVRFTRVGANVVGGLLFGLTLLAYAYGLWTMRRWVLLLSIVYAFYVPVNLVMFWFLNLEQRPSVQFIGFYLAVALTGSVGTAIYLAYHRDRLA